jgi:predicted  nucleic acid-binding Zn-ribbon protein
MFKRLKALEKALVDGEMKDIKEDIKALRIEFQALKEQMEKIDRELHPKTF